ncbi:MAG: F0F1 ATP synthase subunit A [Actinomycetes bacterium]|jgi:F-type H+-transporting ATPase subunit a|nr:F0F1 ATP synthase subunit A [Actinomycetes bacterium]
MAAETVAQGPLQVLPEKVEHLLQTLDPTSIFPSQAYNEHGHLQRILSIGQWTISVNTVYFILTSILVLVLVLVMAKKIKLVPKGRGVNAFEFLVEFVRNNVGGIIKHDRKKYEPFLLTCFVFILISNLIGLIPGAKPGTGIIAGTFALAIVVLVYFNAVGMKAKGAGKYWLGLVPHGVPGWIAPIIWLIEFISMLLRPITLALRLFANMYAGHIILGIFALLTGLFAQATFQGLGLYIAASPAWLILLIGLYLLELVVAFVQAYVFSLLTAVYIDSATAAH